MIIGNGIIANSFKLINHDSLLIFASGVSNSKEIREEEFNKELFLLKETIKINKKIFIYFSSCSIENKLTPYTLHKLKIEKYIEENCENYLIIRLPIVVGNNNKNQLLGFFKEKLINNETINIDLKLKRYLIDVEDLPKIVQILVSNKIKKINVGFNYPISIKKIINVLENIYKLELKYNEIDKNENDYLNFDNFNKIIKDYNFNKNPIKIIKKYYKNESINFSLHI